MYWLVLFTVFFPQNSLVKLHLRFVLKCYWEVVGNSELNVLTLMAAWASPSSWAITLVRGHTSTSIQTMQDADGWRGKKREWEWEEEKRFHSNKQLVLFLTKLEQLFPPPQSLSKGLAMLVFIKNITKSLLAS